MICIAGKTELAVRGLELALDLSPKREVTACLNKSETSQPCWQPSLGRFAREYGVPTITLDEAAKRADLVFISLEFDQLIRPAKFASRRLFNVHFSRLPGYKGMYTAIWPILNNEQFGGTTLHLIDHGIDTGAIIAQRTFPILPNWTSRDLYLENINSAISLLEENFLALIAGNYTAVPQQPKGSSYYNRSSIDFKNIGMDFHQAAEQVERFHRSFYFPEYQVPSLNELSIGHVAITSDRSTAKPGTIIQSDKDKARVATIDFDVLLHRDCSNDFFALVENGDIEGILSYVNPRGSVNSKNKFGWAPLHVAAYGGQSLICRALLAKGADPKATNPNGTNALMYSLAYALKTGDCQALSLLISEGLSLHWRDRFGKSSLDYLADSESKFKATVTDVLTSKSLS